MKRPGLLVSYFDQCQGLYKLAGWVSMPRTASMGRSAYLRECGGFSLITQYGKRRGRLTACVEQQITFTCLITNGSEGWIVRSCDNRGWWRVFKQLLEKVINIIMSSDSHFSCSRCRRSLCDSCTSPDKKYYAGCCVLLSLFVSCTNSIAVFCLWPTRY